MLGPFEDPPYSATTFSVEDGDRIVLITDGILEARDSSGREFGMERLRHIVESNHALLVNRFADALLGELSRWSEDAIGAQQSDDVTLLVIDFKSP